MDSKIMGIGVDLCEISRIQKILDRDGLDSAFFNKIFTDAERKEAVARHDKAAFFAARFAVKEAVFKAVSPLLYNTFDLRIVESLHRDDGSPYVHITDQLKPFLDEGQIRFLHLSVTTEGEYAETFVVAES